MAENEIIVQDEIDNSLGQYPTIIDGTEVPFFPEIKNKPKKIQNVNQSEGGRDIVQVIRRDKMGTSITLNVADFTWVQFFYRLFLKDSFLMKQYNPLLNDYDERTMRIDDFDYGAVKKSEKLKAVTGTWNVSIVIEEF